MVNLITLLERIINKFDIKADIDNSFGYGYGTAIITGDLNNYITPGNYRVKNSSIADTISNSPVTDRGFILKIFYGGISGEENDGNHTLIQLVITNGISALKEPTCYIRFYNNAWDGTTVPKWSDWRKIGDNRNSYSFDLGELISSGKDLNTLTTNGNYRAATNSIAQSLINCPVRRSFILKVSRGATGESYIMQQLITQDGSSMCIRFCHPTNGWGSWYEYSGTVVA